MGHALIARDEVLNRLTRVFRQSGYGATLSQLSEASGLGRASLYHYFPGGKSEMAAAVIERSNSLLAREIIAPLQGSGTPAQRLRAMTRSLDRYFSGGTESCLLGSLTLGASSRGFESHIHAGFSAWIEALAQVLVEHGLSRKAAKLRAEDAVFVIEGALLVCRGLGDVAPFRRVLRELPARLLQPAAA
jgi:TetR/AcrR family transcriptional repressor of lmrAB and yxaGH operons